MLYATYCSISVSERKQVPLVASKVLLITRVAKRQASGWDRMSVTLNHNALPLMNIVRPPSITHLDLIVSCPNIRQSSGAHGRRERQQRGRRALRLLASVINQNHIGSSMRQRQSWIIGQNDNGCSLWVWGVNNAIRSRGRRQRTSTKLGVKVEGYNVNCSRVVKVDSSLY